MSKLVDDLKTEKPELVSSFVDEITNAQHAIESTNRELKQADGAVVMGDGG